MNFRRISAAIVLVGVITTLVMLLRRQIILSTAPRFTDDSSPMVDVDKNMHCVSGIPCAYPDAVDFRIIVITYNRAVSVLKLLNSLNTVLMDGDSGSLEIWVDRGRDGKVDSNTLQAVKQFRWAKGPTRVHVQDKHVGIYGQWIDTWTPTDYSPLSKELAIILEDDITVSPYIYRWIKAVHRHYSRTSDFAGSTLNSDELKSHDGSYSQLRASQNETTFMYKCVGTWGFTPNPRYWRDFQIWYHDAIKNASFHPYVPGILPTEWYKQFERSGTSDSMWEMWHIYYTYTRKLFTVYNNIKAYMGDNNSCLCINRREIGLHNFSKGREDFCTLLSKWKSEFIKFSPPESTWRLDWNGKKIKSY